LNELAVILANNPDVQMGLLPLIFCGFTRLLCAARVCFKLHDSFVLAASSKFPLSEEFKTLLEGAVVGSVIETNIEGIDREFKVTKAQKAFLSTIKVGYVYTSFRGYEKPLV
jgi:hypothetical protein